MRGLIVVLGFVCATLLLEVLTVGTGEEGGGLRLLAGLALATGAYGIVYLLARALDRDRVPRSERARLERVEERAISGDYPNPDADLSPFWNDRTYTR